MTIVSKIQALLPKIASRRVAYLVAGTVEVFNSSKPIQIRNISKTGIQFFTNAPIPFKTQVRLKWRDAKLGDVESQMVVVRTIQNPTTQSQFLFCYGSRFTDEKPDMRRKVYQIIETTEEFERQDIEKGFQRLPSKTIQDVFMYGRSYVQKILNKQLSTEVITPIVLELKDYEKEAFGKSDEISIWIQKLSTQYVHAKFLMAMISGTVRMSGIHKLVQEKMHSMECLMKECDTPLVSNVNSVHLKETLNRVKFARAEMIDLFNKRAIFLKLN